MWKASTHDRTKDKGLPAADGGVDDLVFGILSADPKFKPEFQGEQIHANEIKIAVTMRPKRPENWKIKGQGPSQTMRGGGEGGYIPR